MQTSEELLIKIRDQITAYQLNIKSDNKANRYNINDRAESFTIPLFKIIFGWDELRNLNLDQKNFPGIDIGDTKNRIAIQVTSTITLEKVKDTLKIFIKNKQYRNFNRVVIFMIREKQKSYSQESINRICTNKLTFSVQKDIIDLSDLLIHIKGLYLHDLQTIYRLFLDETGYMQIGLSSPFKKNFMKENKPDIDKKIQIAKAFLQFYYSKDPTIFFNYELISKPEFISKANEFVNKDFFDSDSELEHYLYLASLSFIYG